MQQRRVFTEEFKREALQLREQASPSSESVANTCLLLAHAYERQARAPAHRLRALEEEHKLLDKALSVYGKTEVKQTTVADTMERLAEVCRRLGKRHLQEEQNLLVKPPYIRRKEGPDSEALYDTLLRLTATYQRQDKPKEENEVLEEAGKVLARIGDGP